MEIEADGMTPEELHEVGKKSWERERNIPSGILGLKDEKFDHFMKGYDEGKKKYQLRKLILEDPK